jgi:hypothetical protein
VAAWARMRIAKVVSRCQEGPAVDLRCRSKVGAFELFSVVNGDPATRANWISGTRNVCVVDGVVAD